MSKIINVYKISLEAYQQLRAAGYTVRLVNRPRKGK